MPLVTLDGLYRNRPQLGWAACCFGVFNLETLGAVIGAAEDESAPIAVSIDPDVAEPAVLRALAAAALAAAGAAAVPVAVHLNHARNLDLIMRALDLGFTSVMLDGSALPFPENLALTRRATQIASEAGASVEGELLAPRSLADVEQAAQFARLTGVGYLAVSVDSSGLDLGLLARLAKNCTARLVLHGASRLTEADLTRALRHGVRKVNVHTELGRTFLDGVRSALGNSCGKPQEILGRGMAGTRSVARDALRRCGASGMA